MWGIVVLLVLVYFVWMRDEMRKDTLIGNHPIPQPGNHPIPQPKESNAGKEILGENISTPKHLTDDVLSISFDVEFNEKNPCDYQVPYILQNGNSTFICTCEEMWDRWGVKDKVLANLNDGAREQCARCVGLKCKGKRKNI